MVLLFWETFHQREEAVCPGATTSVKVTVAHPMSIYCLLRSYGFEVESHNVRSFRTYDTRFSHVVPVPIQLFSRRIELQFIVYLLTVSGFSITAFASPH